MFLRFLRRLGLAIFITIFSLALQAAIFLVPVSLVLQNESSIKGWLAEGGAYDNFAALIAKQMTSSDRPDAEQGIKTADLERVIGESLPPDVLQAYGEQIVKAIYAWLRGEMPKPQFKIDLSERRGQIETSIRSLVVERLATASVCPRAVAVDSYDPLRDNCLLPGQTAQSTADNFIPKLFGSEGGLNDLVLDSEKVFKDPDMSQHPLTKVYGLLAPLRIILMVAVLVSGGLAVLLADHWRRGLKRISWITFTTGLFALIGALLMSWLAPSAVNRATLDAGSENVNVSGLVIPVLKAALADIGRSILLFAGPLLVIAVGVLIWLWRSNKKAATAVPVEADSTLAKSPDTHIK